MENKPYEKIHLRAMKTHRIEIITGPMFCGKTEELIRRLNRLNFSRTPYVLFKPEMDTRYSEDEVVSHEKKAIISIPVARAKDILEETYNRGDIQVVAIDEGQFFLEKEDEGPNLYEVAKQLKNEGYRVIINGLDMDWSGKPFGLMPKLMAIADEVVKLKAVCLVCGEDASMSYRNNSLENSIHLGSTDIYQSRCYKHWKRGMEEKEIQKKANEEGKLPPDDI